MTTRLSVISTWGWHVPIQLNPVLPIQNQQNNRRGTILRERRSLVGTHQQSWWFTIVNEPGHYEKGEYAQVVVKKAK